MNIRWSDVVALAAIFTGALVPATLLLGRRAATPPAPDLRIGMQRVEPPLISEPEPELRIELEASTLVGCMETVPPDLRDRRAFIEEQIALHEAERRSLRRATDGVRERVRREITAARKELETARRSDTETRREVLQALQDDLTRMVEAEIVAERAMADMALSLERQLALLEIEAATRMLNEELRRGKTHESRRPCR